MELAGKKVLVVGMARSGLASVELLKEHGAEVTATDLKPLAEMPAVAAELEKLGAGFEAQSPAVFEKAELIVLSPGVPADLPELAEARTRGIDVLGEVEVAGWFLKGTSIGITGANGKTTTTALTGHILREAGVPVQVGGNIGTPVTAMVAGSREEQWNVLELSSFQLETIRTFRAHIGVATNVTPDHLDRHGSFENYAAAKGQMFAKQGASDFAVLNADDPTCAGYAALTPGKTLWFSLKREVEGMWLADGKLWFEGKPFLETAAIPMRGLHNVENTLAAAGAAHLAGVPLPAIAAAVACFPGVEHRLEFVRRVSGVDLYNDSKATNVDATIKALEALPGNLWVILGGKDKGSDYTVLKDLLEAKAKAVLLIGKAAAKIADHLKDTRVRRIDAGTLEQAVAAAYAESVPGDTILLAPACASFDQFRGFEHRGQVFKELAGKLEEKK